MEKEIKIKVGDKVLLKNKRGKGWKPDGAMDEWMGKIVTVSLVIADGSFHIEEDSSLEHLPFRNKWWFEIDDIERVITDNFTRDDLQFADIVTTRNGEKYVVANNTLFGENDGYWMDGEYIPNFYRRDLKYDIDSEGHIYDIIKVERAGQVIWERPEEVKEVKEMTIAEICEALGYEVKVVKETEK